MNVVKNSYYTPWNLANLLNGPEIVNNKQYQLEVLELKRLLSELPASVKYANGIKLQLEPFSSHTTNKSKL